MTASKGIRKSAEPLPDEVVRLRGEISISAQIEADRDKWADRAVAAEDEVVRLRDELATAREVIQESMEARRVTEAEGGSLNQANNEIDRLRARVAELEKLVASVPSLVAAAFQEGFLHHDGELMLGGAWEVSRAKLSLDEGVRPHPPQWGADKDRIALLEASLRAAESRVAELENANRPADLWAIHWSPECWQLFEDQHEAETVLRGGYGELHPLWARAPLPMADAPDVVPVPREELERKTWRDFSAGWAAARQKAPRQTSEDDYALRDSLAAQWNEAMNGVDAIRSGEAGKEAERGHAG